jgi:hypothetical protein
MRLFVFGTLMDPDVMRLVVGRGMETAAPAPARLSGYAARRAFGETFPILVAQPGAVAEGLIVGPFDERELERIRFFDGEEFEMRPVSASGPDGDIVRITACLSTGILADTGEPWSLDQWQAVEKPRALNEIESYMALFGTIAPADANACWAKIKQQAVRRFEEARAERHFSERHAFTQRRGR